MHAQQHLDVVMLQKTGGGGNGAYDPLEVYCEDNPETDECRSVAAVVSIC